MNSNLKTTIIALALLTVFSCWNPSFAQEKRAPKRVALVIGNSEYKTAAKLTNPKNDAQSISKALKSVGFTVTTQFDRSKYQIESDIDAVTEGLVQGDAVFVFFAGHGIELKNSNYLVPTDAAVTREFHVKQRCVDADYVLAAMEDSGASLRVMVLDACRNNPFRSFTRNAGSGLAAMQAPEGTIIAYSTAPGTVALDGTGNNSPFTKHLVNTLQSHPAEGLEISSVFTSVARAVKKETGQRAYLTNDASMERYLLKPAVLNAETKAIMAKNSLRIKKLRSFAADDLLTAVEFREGKRLIEQPLTQLTKLEKDKREVYVSLADGDIAPNNFSKSMSLLVSELANYEFQPLATLREHADLGFPKAQLALGEKLVVGDGVTKDEKMAVDLFRKSAEQNNPVAQLELAKCYSDGLGVEKNHTTAVNWYSQSAASGNAQAQALLGLCYDSGDGVPKDQEKSIDWFRKAAAQGDGLGSYRLGIKYYWGTGLPKDYDKAFPLIKNAAEKGEVVAWTQIGTMLLMGQGTGKDASEGIKWTRKAAEAGQVVAQYSLGYAYSSGLGVSKDDSKAFKWYLKSANQNYALSQQQLGKMYWNGLGIGKDNAEAFRWYRKAADQGNAVAQNSIAVMYGNGEGVAQDDKQAFFWSRKAAEQGNPSAQRNLGMRYIRGRGTQPSGDEGLRWLKKSAAQGYLDAYTQLGNILSHSGGDTYGVSKNDSQAVSYFRIAAEKGDPSAQYGLGFMYYNGRGVPKDNQKSLHWMQKAAAQGNRAAQRGVQTLLNNLTQ